MGEVQHCGIGRLSRREAMGRVAGAGLGAISVLGSVLGAARLSAQGSPPASAANPWPNRNFPQVPSWNTELKELAPNVYAYIQAGGPDRNNVSISDAGVIVGDDGVMVIDSLAAPMHAKAFIAAIRNVTDKPFRHLIVTHHHGDHIGGNQYFMPAEIVGHPYCRDEVLKQARTAAPLWAKREGWADGTEERKVLPPVTTLEGKMTYHYGKTVVEVIPMAPAHTYGDIVVYLPQLRVLFGGDIAFFYVAPFAQNAHVTKWLGWIDTIMKMDIDVIVPGHGPLGGKQNLAEMGAYFQILKREAKLRYEARMSPGRAAAEIKMGKFENWIGPERIVMDTVRLYHEFRGTLVPDVDVQGNREATEEYNALKAKG